MTLSSDPKSSEFIIHVVDEHDYRYLSPSYSEVIASTIRKIVKAKGSQIHFFRVVSLNIVEFLKPQAKLKQFATIKKEVALKKFRRP